MLSIVLPLQSRMDANESSSGQILGPSGDNFIYGGTKERKFQESFTKVYTSLSYEEAATILASVETYKYSQPARFCTSVGTDFLLLEKVIEERTGQVATITLELRNAV